MNIEVEGMDIFSENAIEINKDFWATLLLKEANKEKPDPKIWKNEIFDELFHRETYLTGIYKYYGWMFNYGKSWKRYLVNIKETGWREQKAPNKTFIRKHSTHPHSIIEIIEVDKEKDNKVNKKIIKKVIKNYYNLNELILDYDNIFDFEEEEDSKLFQDKFLELMDSIKELENA